MKGRLRGYCMKASDAIVSKCLWWLTMNGKAHNFVYWNWLMMSSRAKRIRRIFLEAGLSSVQINQEKKLKIHKAYWYGIVEEFVMFTLIYFNRSQHAFGFPGTFKLDVNECHFGLPQLWAVIHSICPCTLLRVGFKYKVCALIKLIGLILTTTASPNSFHLAPVEAEKGKISVSTLSNKKRLRKQTT